MPVKGFQITEAGNIPLALEASSLDEMTRLLPAGFYTTFTTRQRGKKVLGLQSHLSRLYAPAREATLAPSVDEEKLRKSIATLVKNNLPAESRVRLILDKESGSIFIGTQPFERLPMSVHEKGVDVITAEMARNDPQVKDSAFITASHRERQRLGSDVFEVLMTKNGGILEGLTSNFYGIKAKTLHTAQEGILPGVTRQVILQLAEGEGMQIQYDAPPMDETFDEAFLTSSSRGVVPIISIDQKRVGDGRVGVWTKKLSEAYQAYVEERSELILPE
jgi:branched-chain amino acid aminotransferase